MSDVPHDDDLGPDAETVHSVTLIRLAQAGDDSALERLFVRYYPELRQMATRMMDDGLRRRLESGDVLQKVLYRLIQTFDRYEIASRGAFFGLLKTYLRNQLIDEARHQAAEKCDVKREVALDQLTESLGEEFFSITPPAPGPSPSSIVVRREELELVRRCLERLPPIDRLVVELARAGELTWREIAERANVASEDVARVRYGRAEMKLGELVKSRRRI